MFNDFIVKKESSEKLPVVGRFVQEIYDRNEGAYNEEGKHGGSENDEDADCMNDEVHDID